MVFQEPELEYVEIEVNNILETSLMCEDPAAQTYVCPTVATQSRPSVQTCSDGAMQDEDCDNPSINW